MTAPQKRANWHDAFDTQMALWRWYRTDFGREWMRSSHLANAEGIEDPKTVAMSKDLYINELERLLDCDPIFVSADMCELIEYAQESFEVEALLESDIITPRAFMLFERPFQILDRFDQPTNIKAVSWTRIVQSGYSEDAAKMAEIAARLRKQGLEVENYEGGIRIYVTKESREAGGSMDIEERLIEAGAVARGISVTLYCTTDREKMGEEFRNEPYPPVLAMHLTPWYFDMTFDGNEIDAEGVPTGALWWWRILQTTLRMMQQKITVKHHQRPDRAARREMQKHGYRDDTQTVVVRLRGEESQRKEPSGEKANYSHRFIRRYHWRNQWYPSIQQHRQIFIDSTVVGDPDLPLIVKPRRAFQWNR